MLTTELVAMISSGDGSDDDDESENDGDDNNVGNNDEIDVDDDDNNNNDGNSDRKIAITTCIVISAPTDSQIKSRIVESHLTDFRTTHYK